MKILLLSILTTVVFAFDINAQSIERDVLASGGGNYTTSMGENVQFTIGQPFNMETLNSSNHIFLTQGFQQPSAVIVPYLADLHDNGSGILKLDVYPNPAVDYIEVGIDLIDDDGATVSLIDMWGQVLKSQDYQVTAGSQKLYFKFNSHPEGVYTVKVVANKRNYSRRLLLKSGSSLASF